MKETKNIILFGAGQSGKSALFYFGMEQVFCFVDNNPKLSGSEVEGVPVISFAQLQEIYQQYRIIIAMDAAKSLVVARQLEEGGITSYEFFLKILEADQKWQNFTVSTTSRPADGAKKAENSVLMIAYDFPPLSGSGVFRSLKFAKYLPQFGWQPTVFAADRPRIDWSYADQSLLHEIPDSVDVIRLTDPVSTMQELNLAEMEKQLIPFLHEILQSNPKAETLFSTFLQSGTGVAEMLVFPCTELMWTYKVVQYIEQNLDVQQFQAVYTTSPPRSSHLAGAYLKEKYGIPWVADFRDPWSDNPELDFDLNTPKGQLMQYLEAILVEKADCSLTINQELVEKYINRFGLGREKIISITNGYDEEDFTSLRFPAEQTKFFTINYSGILYEKRGIHSVLEALHQLADEGSINLDLVRLRIVGDSKQYDPKKAAKPFGLENIITETGYLSHTEALQSNLDSNLLLLMVGDGEKYKVTTTGKIFDYLRSGRPILAIGPRGGVVDCILQETGHGNVFHSKQIPEIKEMLLREYQKWQSGAADQPLRSPKIQGFERRLLTKQLAELFSKLSFQQMGGGDEFSNQIYDDCYQSGGANGNYHKHYTQSMYYLSWKSAMTYIQKLDPSTKILEVGCGVGQFANMLFDQGFTNYTGFDFSEEAVKWAKQTNAPYADRFFTADAFETELITKQYDLVICFEVLEHLWKDLELLERIPSGTPLLLSLPNFDDPYHVRYFQSEDEVRQRYRQVMRIADIKTTILDVYSWLYYIWGEKL